MLVPLVFKSAFKVAEMLYASVADGLPCVFVRPLEQRTAPLLGGEKSAALLTLRFWRSR